MNLLFWGLSIGVIGKSLVAVAVLLAHHTIAREHRIDRRVLRTFRTEFVITVIGLLCIIIGYLLEVLFFHRENLLLF